VELTIILSLSEAVVCLCAWFSADCEHRLRVDAEDCKAQLLCKVAFDADVHEQRVNDLEQRLANHQRIVEALNEKLKGSASNDGKEAMTSMIHRLREQMAAEFDKYRRATLHHFTTAEYPTPELFHFTAGISGISRTDVSLCVNCIGNL